MRKDAAITTDAHVNSFVYQMPSNMAPLARHFEDS
jgi:hypothetical protein